MDHFCVREDSVLGTNTFLTKGSGEVHNPNSLLTSFLVIRARVLLLSQQCPVTYVQSRRPHCVSPNTTSKKFIGTTVILCEKLSLSLVLLMMIWSLEMQTWSGLTYQKCQLRNMSEKPNARHKVHKDAVMMSRDVVFFCPCWFVLWHIFRSLCC